MELSRNITRFPYGISWEIENTENGKIYRYSISLRNIEFLGSDNTVYAKISLKKCVASKTFFKKRTVFRKQLWCLNSFFNACIINGTPNGIKLSDPKEMLATEALNAGIILSSTLFNKLLYPAIERIKEIREQILQEAREFEQPLRIVKSA